jgi:hypothetical protein
MDSNPKVLLRPDLLAKCWQWAGQVIADYEAPPNASIERSRGISYRGAERNRGLLARAKMAECAFCLWAGIDPLMHLGWDRHADSGYDVRWAGHSFDIKHSELIRPRYLLWPIRKNHLFEKKNFTALVLVGDIEPEMTLWGWVTKAEFQENCYTADENHKLDTGTWYMDQRDLRGMEELLVPCH